jgi:hypothetical protein
MKKRLPTQVTTVIPITTVFIIFLIIALIAMTYMWYQTKNGGESDHLLKYNSYDRNEYHALMPIATRVALQPDVLRDPYVAPMKDERYYFGGGGGVVPINIQTQGPSFNCGDIPYRQLGILTRKGLKDSGGGGEEQIFPLMGRPLLSNRDTWNFYTMNDKFNMIKLPVIHKGKNGTSEYGCDNIFTNDIVKVEGMDNSSFKATMYENQTMRYLPY